MHPVAVESTNLDKANRARRFYAAERYLRRTLDAQPSLTPGMRQALVAILLADIEAEQ